MRPLTRVLGALLAVTALSVAAPVHAGFLDLTWDAPTTNTDGTPLTDLAGYRIYYRTSSGACGASTYRTLAAPSPTPSPGSVSYQLTGLTTGTTYFITVAAEDLSGNVGPCSNEVSAAAKADWTVSPTGTADFGSVIVGQSSTQTFTVTNQTASALSVSVSVASPFSVTSPGTSFAVAGGASVQVTVRFAPTTTGTFSQTLTFSSSAGTISRTLTGTGTSSGGGTAGLSVSPTGTVDFGSVTVGQSADRTFTVTNQGTTSLTVSVAASAPFSVVSPGTSFSLSAGATRDVVIRFTPTSPGNISRVVTFAAGTDTLTRTLAGVGVSSVGQAPLYFPHFNDDREWWTALTLANPGGTAATATVEAFNTAGTRLGSATLTIPAGAQGTPRLLSDLLGITGSGWLRITATQPVVGALFVGGRSRPSLDIAIPYTE